MHGTQYVATHDTNKAFVFNFFDFLNSFNFLKAQTSLTSLTT